MKNGRNWRKLIPFILEHTFLFVTKNSKLKFVLKFQLAVFHYIFVTIIELHRIHCSSNFLNEFLAI